MVTKVKQKMSEQDILIMRLYSSAQSWNETSQLMVEAEKLNHKLRISLNAVLPLAVELSLKTILAIGGHCECCLTESRHKLSELFGKLGEKNLDAISKSFTAAYKQKIGEEIDFMKLVKQHDKCFVEWRYLDFVKDIDNIDDDFDYQFITNLQRTMAGMMEKIHGLHMKGVK